MEELFSATAEQYIIRCMFNRPNTVIEIVQNLKSQDFFYQATRYLFIAIKQLSGDGDISSEGIMTFLESRNHEAYLTIKGYGGAGWIEKTFKDDTLPASPSVKEQMKIIKSFTYRRNAVEVAEKIKTFAQSNIDIEKNKEFENVEDLDEKIKEVTYSLAENISNDTEVEVIGNGIDSLLAEIRSGEIQGIDIGFLYPKLNKIIKRLRNGTLTVIGAPEKVGKSTIMLDIAWNVAYKLGLPVAYCDTEMTSEETLLRILSKISGIPEDDIVNNNLSDQEIKIVDAYCQEMKKVKFFHFNVNDMTNAEVESKVKLLQLKHDIRLLVYDYCKIQSHEVEKGRPDLILASKIDMLKERIAKQCNIPVITSGQMYPRNDERGKINKFCETSHFTKLADNIMRLDRTDPNDVNKVGTHYIEIVTGRKIRVDDVGKQIEFDFDMSKHKITEL